MRGAEEVAFHVHVDAGFEGLAGHGRAVADGVIHELGDRAPIGDHEAVEAPLLAQNLGEGKRIGGGGNAVDGVEGAHHRGRAGFDRGMVGREVDLAQRDLAHVGGVVVAAGDGGAVGGEVLDADGDRIGLGEIALLVALDPGARHRGAEIGVFAVGLDDAAPARIAGDVDHGREDPGDAVGAGFGAPVRATISAACGIPAGGDGERNGKRGVVAVDHVEPEEEGDVQARLLHGDVLVVVGLSAPTTLSIEPTWPLATRSS